MANTDDFRYVATEDAIHKAFLTLAAKHGIKAVTVTDLCREADISRNAFYSHYPNILTLCMDIVTQLSSNIQEECLISTQKAVATHEPDKHLPDAIFDVFVKYEDLIRIILSTDDGEVAKRFADDLAETYATSAAAFGASSQSEEHQLMCMFTAWAHIGFLRQWVLHSDKDLEGARGIFDKLQSQIMQPHYRFLLESLGGR